MKAPQTRVQHANRFVQGGFTMVPNVVLMHKALSVEARFLYGLLKHIAWQYPEDGPDQKELAGLLGVGERQFRRYVAELKDAGLLEVRQSSGRSALYVLIEDERFFDAEVVDGELVAGHISPARPVKGDRLSIIEDPSKTELANASSTPALRTERHIIADVVNDALSKIIPKIESGYGYDLYEEILNLWNEAYAEAREAGVKKNIEDVGVGLLIAFYRKMTHEEPHRPTIIRLNEKWGKFALFGLNEAISRGVDLNEEDELAVLKYAMVCAREYKLKLEAERAARGGF